MHPTGHGLGAGRSWGTTTRCGDQGFRPWSRGRLAGKFMPPATRSLIAVWTWTLRKPSHCDDPVRHAWLVPRRIYTAVVDWNSKIHVVIQGTLRGVRATVRPTISQGPQVAR